MPHNTLQIYINDIYFDRPALTIMWGYVATFVRANVDGDYQMYLSPASFKIVRIDRPGQPDLVHRYDGDGLLVASLPTSGLESVSLTAFFIRDREKQRDAGELIRELLSNHDDGAALTAALEPLLAKIPKFGAIASMLIKLPRAVGGLLSTLLKARKDVIKIYGDGTQQIRGVDEDFTMRWGIGQGDKGFFNTTWDFRTTKDPYAMVTNLVLPADLEKRLRLDG